MNKEEFLHGLEIELSSTGSRHLINKNTGYYRTYILEEMGKGRSETEILEELGDPRLIAMSIKAANNINEEGGEVYRESYTYEGQSNDYRKDMEEKSSFYKHNVRHIGIWLVVTLMIIILILGTLFIVLLPILVPIALTLLIVYFIKIFDR